MISEVNGVRNYGASKAAMKSLYWIVGGIVAIRLFLTLTRVIFGAEISIVSLLIFIMVAGLFAGVIIPGYFGRSHLSVSGRDIVCIKGMVTDRKVYLKMDAVKSVTMVVTPFGGKTGLNLIVFNAMGSRLIVWFLDKEDCVDIYGFVNEVLAGRSSPDGATPPRTT